MVLESAQLLCTTVAMCNDVQTPYKVTHKNHPCSIWAKASLSNFNWLCEHALAICEQYTRRYGKVHKSQAVIEWCIDNPPSIADIGLTEFAQVMPDEYRCADVVEAYRNYYCGEKVQMLGKSEVFLLGV